MKKKSMAIVIVSIIITFCIWGYLYYIKTASFSNEEYKQAITKIDNKKNNMYVVLDVPMENKNMIWCGTFQMAWNELRDNMIKEDIILEGDNILVKELNKKNFTKNDIDENSYIAMVGYNKDGIVEKVNKALKDKFNEGGKWQVETVLNNPNDILAYAFLKKNVEFEYAFENLKDGVEFSDEKVQAFGIGDKTVRENKEALLNQIRILYYGGDDDFIISLKGKNPEDELILSKIPPQDTLNNTLKYALDHRKNDGEVYQVASLKIPKLNFDFKKNFTELEDKKVLNKGFEDYKISSAIQRTQFDLTEKGAELKSKGEISMKKSSLPISKPKNLIFDKPFLLYMKEKDKNRPYFVTWINNTDIMKKQ
ncbi:Serpin (serine protease inhibitor) [Clostridium cavendishii DSM 21758]|uniref:Serpin (Serine protease inhibitor) n=1 Tax=Clostridium cavendishii DSM 21758 TaxID=1121302 RepID=A0A1M6NI58_9CLOT|nr:serpin family protein [Clostridium cavendishii]SHJ95294.1 Serpin (serine protease inhibitor) [Clostridium cavendishii DSM 21758]